MNARLKLRTYLRLGLGNVARVIWYRLLLRAGFHPVQKIRRQLDGQNFFTRYSGPDIGLPKPSAWTASGRYFGWFESSLNDEISSWHTNPFNQQQVGESNTPWWKISDFALEVGDIKTIWEASRFDWVLAFAQRAATGEKGQVERLNLWLEDWCRNNPAYLGVNWKCGQEASIRVMHLALAAHLMGQTEKPADDMARLVEAHLARIRPTLAYARAQDNNHGTSEAAALFIGGIFCRNAGIAVGKKWSEEGRILLEERVSHLVMPDGSFSQYSVNYHRLMLDTLSLVELWRRWMNLPEFSKNYRQKVTAATDWLYNMVDDETGAVPNLGSNDGANLLPLTDAPYGDYRPSVALAMALFSDCPVYGRDGFHREHLGWLMVEEPGQKAPRKVSRNFASGGYGILRKAPWTVFLKYPRYKFRPNHCDALHLDLWLGSDNLLKDAGSFGYNAEAPWSEYFPGVAAHNTVAFDDHEQMPAMGRFLRGAWLETDSFEIQTDTETTSEISAGYQDWTGCRHLRRVLLTKENLIIEDEIEGFQNRAILRWRLAPGTWVLQGQTVRSAAVEIQIECSVPIRRIEIVQGWESLHYLQKSDLSVLEVEVSNPGRFLTQITRIT